MTKGVDFLTRRISDADPECGFRCGKHPLDDFFRRHALDNHRRGLGSTYVLAAQEAELSAHLPAVLGYYTLSMASATGDALPPQPTQSKLPRYPLPVALVGRLAVDQRAQRRSIGELLLIDALRRIVAAAELIACLGVIVDAKDEEAEHFYDRYDFVTVHGESWPRRMFLAIDTARSAVGAD